MSHLKSTLHDILVQPRQGAREYCSRYFDQINNLDSASGLNKLGAGVRAGQINYHQGLAGWHCFAAYCYCSWACCCPSTLRPCHSCLFPCGPDRPASASGNSSCPPGSTYNSLPTLLHDGLAVARPAWDDVAGTPPPARYAR